MVQTYAVVENTELAPFASPTSQIAFQPVDEKDFVPDGNYPKKTLLVKCKSYEGMGWSWVGVRWKTFRELPRTVQLDWLQKTMPKIVQKQKNVIKMNKLYHKKSIIQLYFTRMFSQATPEQWDSMQTPAMLYMTYYGNKPPEGLTMEQIFVSDMKMEEAKEAQIAAETQREQKEARLADD